MFFKSIDVVGFKSFATRTTFDFMPGTTVVVGVVGQNEVRTTHSHFCKRSLCLLCLEPATGLQVIVTPPYTPESATGGDDKSLAHVQKVVRCTAVASKLPFLP